jgi:hypothetical protein
MAFERDHDFYRALERPGGVNPLPDRFGGGFGENWIASDQGHALPPFGEMVKTGVQCADLRPCLSGFRVFRGQCPLSAPFIGTLRILTPSVLAALLTSDGAFGSRDVGYDFVIGRSSFGIEPLPVKTSPW